jgi:nitroimidazol reductase NimA-like FMN-containing flavoprotein (pyridoxamine 5'-phosphate oxidase superfamily)
MVADIAPLPAYGSCVNAPTSSLRLAGPAIFADPLVRELLESRLIAVLATHDPGGVIHAMPMWFASDDDAIWLATGSRSHKVANLGHDSRATLVVHDSRSGFEVCGVSIVGRVEILRGEAARGSIELVHRRYVAAAAEGNRLVREFLDSDDVALHLRPESAWTWDERGSSGADELRAIGGALPLLPTTPRA